MAVEAAEGGRPALKAEAVKGGGMPVEAAEGGGMAVEAAEGGGMAVEAGFKMVSKLFPSICHASQNSLRSEFMR